MIPTIKPVTKDVYPFRRMLRSERPASTLFTTIAAHTNENDLAVLQSRNSMLSVEDISVLTKAQEETQYLPYATTPDQIYPSLPADENQISFEFIENQQAPALTPVQQMGTMLSEDA